MPNATWNCREPVSQSHSPQPLQTFHQIDRAAQNRCPKVAGFFEALANRSNGELLTDPIHAALLPTAKELKP